MRRLMSAFAALALCFCLVSCNASDETELSLRIYFLDVGQGDSILLRTPSGDVLIDAGPESSEELLCLRLEQLGVTELALAIFTHPDEDHVGGADSVLSQIPTREIWINGAPMEGESAEMLLQTAEKLGVEIQTVRAGMLWQLGEVHFSVLAPIGSNLESGNENSIVLKVRYGEIDAIFTGDAGIEQEETLVKRYGASQLACELYKVGHHGSNTSSGESFLNAVKPQYAVISCGAGNSYGHPFGEVLERLERVGAEVLRTDLLGEIVFETDGTVLRCISEK